MENNTEFEVRNDLVGHYFHTYKYMEQTQQDEISMQGCIEGKINDLYYIVQYFSFAMGEDIHSAVVHINEICTWKLYKDNETANWHYSQYQPHFQKRLERSKNGTEK